MSKHYSQRTRQKRQSQQAPHVVAVQWDETEIKSNPAYAQITGFGGMDMPQPHMMPKNYGAFAKEGYKGNDTIYKCINYIITNGAAIPPKLYTDDTHDTEIKAHPLLDKLKRPNPEQSGVRLRKAILGYYLVAGNSYLYAIRKATQGPPDELWTLQPDKVKINPTKFGVQSYDFDDFAGSVTNPTANQNPIPAANILHLKTWSPDDPLFGISPIEVGSLKVDQQTAAQKWNLALLQNWARMPGAFTTPIIMDPNTRSKTEDKINQKVGGFRNAGKIPLLDGGLTWQQMGVPPTEMDWLSSIQYNAGALANLYNMPPQLIGDTSSTTYNNMEQAKAASYTEEIFPVLDETYAELTNWLVPMYPDLCNPDGTPKACLYYDKDSVEVVQAVIQQQKTAKAQRANQAWMQGSMMLDEARELQGLPPLPKGAGQVFRFGAVIVRASELDDYADQSLQKPAAPPAPVPEPMLNQPTTPGNPVQPPSSAPLQGNDNESNTTNTPPPTTKPGTNDEQHNQQQPSNGKRLSYAYATKALDLTTDAEKKAYHNQVEAQRHEWEDEIAGRLQDYFKSEQQAVVSAIRHSTATATDENHLLDQAHSAVTAHKSTLQHIISNTWRDVGQDFAKSTEQQFGDAPTKSLVPLARKGFAETFYSSQIIQYLLNLSSKKVVGINDTVMEMIRLALANGVEGGESIPQLAKRIDQLYLDEIIPNRSQVIASTEVCSSSNWGSMQYAKQSGLTLNKVWQATDDAHTREWHADASGQSVPMNSKFEVGGEEMEYPGDPTASGRNTINCRCSMYYQRVAGDASSGDESDASSADDTTSDEEEKRQRRRAYKKFMEAALA